MFFRECEKVYILGTLQVLGSAGSWLGLADKGAALNVSGKESLPLKASQVQFTGKSTLKVISNVNFYALEINWA